MCLFFGARLIQQNSRFYFFLLAYFFFQFVMNLLVKIYTKKHDRHNKTLCTTDFFNLVFCLVYCSSINLVPYFILKKNKKNKKKNSDRPKFDTSAAQEKKKKKKKTHLGQVFQSVTSFET